MKTLLNVCAIFGLISPVVGQDEVDSSKWDVEIPEPISDPTRTPPAAKPAPIDFKVISSRTTKMDVVKAPEMPGLPPVTGTINVTVRMVEDPGLPVPVEPLPVMEPDDPAVVARFQELRDKYRGTDLVFISASVYDRRRTLLRIHNIRDMADEVTAWSNLDFNHFAGFSIYRVRDAVDGTLYDYGILMGLGNEDTERLSELAVRNDWTYKAPEIPRLPDLADGGPAFVVIEGDAQSPAMATLEQLHDLYRKEGVRMKAESDARERVRAERRAYLLANPPKPADVTISFWKRTKSAVAPPEPTTENTSR